MRILPEKFVMALDARREAVEDRFEQQREMLAERAAMIRERFAERVSEEAVTNFAGLTVASTGVAWGVTNWVRGRRSALSLLGPALLVATGLAVVGGGAWRRRSRHIHDVEGHIEEQLAGVGPIARVQIVREMAAHAVPHFRRGASAN